MSRSAEVPDPLRRPASWSRIRHQLPEGAVRTRAVQRVTRGAYVPRDRADNLIDRLLAVALVVCVEAAFSHTTAALVVGAPLPPHRGHRLHVTTPDGWEAPERKGIVGHCGVLPAAHLTTVRGVKITRASRTLLDLAGMLDLADLVAVGDFCLGQSLCTLAELEEMTQWGRGRRGVRRLRMAIRLMNGDAWSRTESLVRVWCVQAGLPEPEVNGWITDPSGIPRYRGDLVFRAARVIVEYDGGHHRDAAQFAADLRRRNDLQRWGWRIVHVEASMLSRPEAIVSLVREAVLAGQADANRQLS
jgi:hypothetical protein